MIIDEAPEGGSGQVAGPDPPPFPRQGLTYCPRQNGPVCMSPSLTGGPPPYLCLYGFFYDHGQSPLLRVDGEEAKMLILPYPDV